MAAFLQDFSITQSNDCETVTFADTSNFSDNDEGYSYATFTTKTIGVYDQDNNLIGDLIDIVNSTPVTFTLDKDRYLHLVYTLSNDTLDLEKVKNILLTCYIELKYGEAVVSQDCNCGCGGEDNLCKVLKAMKAADIFARRGNAIKSQDSIDLANEYIDCNNNS